MTIDERKDRLFRGKATRRYAKEIQKGEWVIGGYVGDYNMGGVGATPCIYYNNGAMYMVAVDPCTIGKCTGLRDKNGVLIFEDDIVSVTQFSDCGKTEITGYKTRVVVWGEDSAAFWYAPPDGYPRRLFVEPEDDEVIGNIHDNSELLKEGT